MKNVCLSVETVPGFDVSHYQQNLKIYSQMAAQGKRFCFIKAIEGTIADDMLVKHYTAAKASGMLVGFYDFFHPSMDPISQAARMKQLIGPLASDDLGCVVDAETTDGVSAFQDTNDLFQFMTTIQTETKKTPGFYSYPYFIQNLKLDGRFLRFWLWISHMGVACPLIPDPWTIPTFWQYSNSNGALDLNKFNGSMTNLLKFCS